MPYSRPGREVAASAPASNILSIPDNLEHLVDPVRNLIDSFIRERVDIERDGRAVDYPALERLISEKTAAIETAAPRSLLEAAAVASRKESIHRGRRHGSQRLRLVSLGQKRPPAMMALGASSAARSRRVQRHRNGTTRPNCCAARGFAARAAQERVRQDAQDRRVLARRREARGCPQSDPSARRCLPERNARMAARTAAPRMDAIGIPVPSSTRPAASTSSSVASVPFTTPSPTCGTTRRG